MPAEGPKWREFGETNELLIVLDHSVRRSLTEDVHLNLASDRDEREGRGTVIVIAEDWGHCIGISEEETDVSLGVLG